MSLLLSKSSQKEGFGSLAKEQHASWWRENRISVSSQIMKKHAYSPLDNKKRPGGRFLMSYQRLVVDVYLKLFRYVLD
jgi:hypothetical protein